MIISRLMEVLAEHLCQGWLEGYLLILWVIGLVARADALDSSDVHYQRQVRPAGRALDDQLKKPLDVAEEPPAVGRFMKN